MFFLKLPLLENYFYSLWLSLMCNKLIFIIFFFEKKKKKRCFLLKIFRFCVSPKSTNFQICDAFIDITANQKLHLWMHLYNTVRYKGEINTTLSCKQYFSSNLPLTLFSKATDFTIFNFVDALLKLLFNNQLIWSNLLLTFL